LGELLEGLCEERLAPEQLARLEQIVLADPAAARYYVEYMHLHGTLIWDTAKSAGSERSVSRPQVSRQSPPQLPTSRPTRHRKSVVAVLAAVVLMVTGVAAWQFQQSESQEPVVAQSGGGGLDDSEATHDKGPSKSGTNTHSNDDKLATNTDRDRSLAGVAEADRESPSGVATPHADVAGMSKDSRRTPSTTGREEHASSPSVGIASNGAGKSASAVGGSDRGSNTGTLLAFVNDELRTGWDTEQVKPSPRAEETEWLRRAHLDIVGRIPAPGVVERFLKDNQPGKHARMIDTLLDDPQYVRHWTTVWTNLLIGRSTSHDAQRTGLQKFLREGFAHNRAWKDLVFDLVSAEGTPEENGATGFLLAHLNNEAVPATAITARVFLGTQVQCTQCHNHPANDSRQNEFWEFNSFFQQTALVEKDVKDPLSGKTVRRAALVNREVGGPNFYETRQALMRAAFPKFGGEQIDPSPQVNRRRELARLMVEDDGQQLARSFVNRTWEHFFGAAFTRPVDDMGPHNPPSHPALLDRLTTEFVQSGYDVKQLVRWICQSDAYRLSSRFSDSNAVDDPDVGNTPLFSRVYVKSMTAEQLYDSLIVATKADELPRALSHDMDRQRDQWIQQFILDYATEENDEASTFDGTIPQALLVMNGELVSAAVSSTPGTLLHEVVQDRGSENDKIRRLSLAALSRYPTAKEMAALKKALHERVSRAPRSQSRDVLVAEGFQDVFWAFLNSNEFVLVH
jgi:hypothetical protein